MPTYTNIHLPGKGYFHKYKGVWTTNATAIDIDLNGPIQEVIDRLTEASSHLDNATVTVQTDCNYDCGGEWTSGCSLTSQVSGDVRVTEETIMLIEAEVARQKEKYKADAPKREAAAEKARKIAETRRQKEVADFIKYHPELVIVPKESTDDKSQS